MRLEYFVPIVADALRGGAAWDRWASEIERVLKTQPGRYTSTSDVVRVSDALKIRRAIITTATRISEGWPVNLPPEDSPRAQRARARIVLSHLKVNGSIGNANKFPCVECGHFLGDPRVAQEAEWHDYDHAYGYEPANMINVESV